MEIRCEEMAQRLDKCEPCVSELSVLKARLIMLETTFLALIDAKNIPLMKKVEEDLNARAALEPHVAPQLSADSSIKRDMLQERLMESRATQKSRHSAEDLLKTPGSFIDKNRGVSSTQTGCTGTGDFEGNIAKGTSSQTVNQSLILEVNDLTDGQVSPRREPGGLVGSASSNRGVYALKNPGRQRDPPCDCQAMPGQQQHEQQQLQPLSAAEGLTSQQRLAGIASPKLSWHADQLPVMPKELRLASQGLQVLTASDNSYSITEQQQWLWSAAGLRASQQGPSDTVSQRLPKGWFGAVP